MASMITPEQSQALLRNDFHIFLKRSFLELNPATDFAENWHLEVMAEELDRCRTGETKRLIINLPPRSLKSHCASVAFPSWILAHNPSAQIICASYAQDLADKHAIDCRALMGSAFYKGLFRTRLSSEKRAVADFLTTRRGCRKATSVGGVLTGRGADFIIIDDPLQPDKALSDARRNGVNDWYDNTLVSRLNHKLTGCIVIVMQRLHEDDLVGHVLDIERRLGLDLAQRWRLASVAGGGTLGGSSRMDASAGRGGSPRLQSGEGGLSVRREESSLPKTGFSPGLSAGAEAQNPNDKNASSRSVKTLLPPTEVGCFHPSLPSDKSEGFHPNNGTDKSMPFPEPPTLEPKWKIVRFPAIAEEDERYEVHRLGSVVTCGRKIGEPLHPEREPMEVLRQLRETLGEYHWAGQYQQSPAPMGGGIIKAAWFKTYTEADKPETFDMIVQSWDTANKASELSDYSVCTTWGAVRLRDGNGRFTGWRLYLLHVLRERMEYPELKRRVRAHALAWSAKNVLIEDRASGTQLIQDLKQEGMSTLTRCDSTSEKVIRMSTASNMIENGYVYLPEHAPWLAIYLQEMVTFDHGKHDDQVDSTSQALNWFKTRAGVHPVVLYYRELAEEARKAESQPPRFTREWAYRNGLARPLT